MPPHGQKDEVTQESPPEEVLIINGEWMYNPPDVEDTLAFLAAQGMTYTVKVLDYASYVVPLSRNKNIGTKDNPNWILLWNIYMTVAGRIKMFNDDLENRRLIGVIEPDQTCEPAGWLYKDGERLVYRVIVKVMDPRELNAGIPLEIGRRAGTVWVPWSGGTGAVKSNRFEKAETSATGRALAAWGYGVLPGSGIASLEEMTDRQVEPEVKKPRVKRNRKQLEDELEDCINKLADLRNEEPMEIAGGIAKWVKEQYRRNIVTMAEDKNTTWWAQLKEGELLLIVKDLNSKIAKAQTD